MLRNTLSTMLLTSSAILVAGAAFATTDTFVGPGTEYENGANWDGGVVPGTAYDYAAITNGSPVSLTSYLDPADTTKTPNELRIGVNNANGELNLSGNAYLKCVANTSLRVGYNSTTGYYNTTGTLSISGGTLLAAKSAYIGVGSMSGSNSVVGTATISGGLLQTGTQLQIGVMNGASTPSSLLLNGGSVAVGTNLMVGSGNGATQAGIGTVTVGLGSTLRILSSGGGTSYIGYGSNGGGTGTVTLDGGAYNLGPNDIVFGFKGTGATADAGYLNVNSGSLTQDSTATMYVGYRDQTVGVVTQTDGTVTVGKLLLVGYSTGSGSGAYNLTGGTLKVVGGTLSSPASAGTKTLSVAGGVLDMSGGTISALTNFNFSGGVLLNASVTTPVTLASGGSGAAVQEDSTGTISSGVTGDGSLTKLGYGALILSGVNTYTGKTTVASGTLQMTPAAYGTVLSHTADIQGGQMVFDYTGDVTPVAAVRSSLHSGAMYTSTGAAQGCGVGYSDDGLSTITAKVALLGDTDMGGTVNNDDLARLLSALGGADCVWQQGDFNYDSKVNNDDLAMLLSNLGKTFAGFGSAKAQALGGAVPEPSTLVLLTAGLIGLAAYAWRKRK
ncbi:MAG: autotransporter-associated beta strand repeat-containing protein [Thermoguttaceae bacterium]